MFQTGNGLPQVEFGSERLDLLHQAVYQFLCAAYRKGRDIIYGFIGIEFGALAARLFQRVHHVCLDVQQAQLKNLEQATGAGANNYHICFDHHTVLARGFFQVPD